MRKYRSVKSINNEFFIDDLVTITRSLDFSIRTREYIGRIVDIDDVYVTIDTSVKYYSHTEKIALLDIAEIKKQEV